MFQHARLIHHALNCSLLLAITAARPCVAQSNSPIPQVIVPVNIDSGLVQNDGKVRNVIYSTVIQSAGAPWIRLKFDQAQLGRTPLGGQSTILRLTSLADGAQQNLKNIQLQQWRFTSAYFNGDAVKLEIIADPDAPSSQVSIRMLWAGVAQDGGIATICGADDRVLSFDPRAARILPIGCTGWLFNDQAHCMITAGHCAGGADTIEFNVPLSTPSGALQHPPPSDQYAVDQSSLQSTNGGLGNDWGYYGCFPNTETDLTPYEAQGDAYVLAAAAPAVNGQTIRITGYGVDSSPSQNNQVQQTSTGPYTQLSGLVLNYKCDTTGGNSGSAVQDESNSTVIGIHTNGGCDGGGGGTNKGTAINNGGLQNALANPDGVCIPQPSLTFTFPDGIPANLNPTGDSIRVEVNGAGGAQALEGSGMLYHDSGNGLVSVPMQMVESNVYDAVFPTEACGANISFYFSAETTKRETVFQPELAPGDSYNALATLGMQTKYANNFNLNVSDWTITNSPDLAAGAWQQAAPLGGGGPNEPPADAEGFGRCFLTQKTTGVDVDGGPTILTSPTLDASDQVNYISYNRWFSSSSTKGDSLLVEVSDDDGASWVTLETIIGGQNAWVHEQWTVGEIAGIDPSRQLRVRFTVTDVSPDSTVEAGIDLFQLTSLECPSMCPADIVPSGSIDVDDLLAVINQWGPCATCSADISPTGGNAIVDVDDLLAVINAWGPCP